MFSFHFFLLFSEVDSAHMTVATPSSTYNIILQKFFSSSFYQIHFDRHRTLTTLISLLSLEPDRADRDRARQGRLPNRIKMSIVEMLPDLWTCPVGQPCSRIWIRSKCRPLSLHPLCSLDAPPVWHQPVLESRCSFNQEKTEISKEIFLKTWHHIDRSRIKTYDFVLTYSLQIGVFDPRFAYVWSCPESRTQS